MKRTNYSKTILASYATFKELYSSNKYVSVYQILANEFLNLVDQANKNGKVITLKFFRDVRDDLDHFYERAERIVCSK